MFVLGSAQFGLKYAGSKGNLSNIELSNILDLAYENGVREIDTAEIYGNAEELLGQVGCCKFHINSKLPPNIPHNCIDIVDIVLKKIKRLNIDNLNILYIHDVSKFINHPYKDKLYNDLQICMQKGLISKIGISIYDTSEINKLSKDFEFQVIQGPFNFFDDRLLKYSETNCTNNISFQFRSIFLQGILINKNLRKNLPFLERLSFFDKQVQNYGFNDRLSFCLTYTNQILKSNKFILGVRNLKDLKKIIKLKKTNKTYIKLKRNIFIKSDYKLVSPYLWRSK